jgi:hypothetical protein
METRKTGALLFGEYGDGAKVSDVGSTNSLRCFPDQTTGAVNCRIVKRTSVLKAAFS